MRSRVVLCIVLSCASAFAGAVPPQITYQGTLKDGEAAAQGRYSMRFRITDETGANQYWASPEQSVDVRNGLFAVQLAPAAIEWQNITPFIEVSVGGQALLPRQPLTTTPYALVSRSVVDDSVSAAQLTPAARQALIPAGMIALFAGGCPPSWSRFAALDNRFPMGAASAGTLGGSEAHAHPLAAHQLVHGAGGELAVGIQPGERGLTAFTGGGSATIQGLDAVTEPRSHLPPFYTVVYCQKQ